MDVHGTENFDDCFVLRELNMVTLCVNFSMPSWVPRTLTLNPKVSKAASVTRGVCQNIASHAWYPPGNSVFLKQKILYPCHLRTPRPCAPTPDASLATWLSSDFDINYMRLTWVYMQMSYWIVRGSFHGLALTSYNYIRPWFTCRPVRAVWVAFVSTLPGRKRFG